jgi:hypothetical protein
MRMIGDAMRSEAAQLKAFCCEASLFLIWFS